MKGPLTSSLSNWNCFWGSENVLIKPDWNLNRVRYLEGIQKWFLFTTFHSKKLNFLMNSSKWENKSVFTGTAWKLCGFGMSRQSMQLQKHPVNAICSLVPVRNEPFLSYQETKYLVDEGRERSLKWKLCLLIGINCIAELLPVAILFQHISEHLHHIFAVRIGHSDLCKFWCLQFS